MRAYKALVWPAGPGIWDDQPTVGRCHAPTIDEAVTVLLANPQVGEALIEEDPRLGGGRFSGDDHWCDDYPDRANVSISGYDEDVDDYPMLAVFVDNDVVGWDKDGVRCCLDCGLGGEEIIREATRPASVPEGDDDEYSDKYRETCEICGKFLTPTDSG